MAVKGLTVLAFVAAAILLALVTSPDDQSEAIAVIHRLGGNHFVDLDKPGKPVISAALSKAGPDGEGLKSLRAFPQLRELDMKDPEDAGRHLIHLTRLNQIKEISLDRSPLTDAGMKQPGGVNAEGGQCWRRVRPLNADHPQENWLTELVLADESKLQRLVRLRPGTQLQILQECVCLRAPLVLRQPRGRPALCPSEAAWTPRVGTVANQDSDDAEVVAACGQHEGCLIGIRWAVNFTGLSRSAPESPPVQIPWQQI